MSDPGQQTRAVMLPDPHHEAKLRGSGEFSYYTAPRHRETISVCNAQAHANLHTTTKINSRQKHGLMQHFALKFGHGLVKIYFEAQMDILHNFVFCFFASRYYFVVCLKPI